MEAVRPIMVSVELEYGPVVGANRLGEDAVQELGGVFSRARSRENIPGISFGVMCSAGMLCSGSEGSAELEPEVGITAHTIFRIASMTKSVTACCVLMLRDAGMLDLDDPVGTYLPGFRQLGHPVELAQPVTLRNLLTMSAGLVEDDPWADRQLDMPAGAFDALLNSGIPLNHPPGFEFEYSNLGYAILGRVVEVISGKSLPEFASQRLLQPLGMAATCFELEEVPSELRATGYRISAGQAIPERPLHHGAFGAMGGLWTSVGDFSRYAQFHLRCEAGDEPNRASPISSTTVREMQQPQRAIRPGRAIRAGVGGVGYGFGLFSGWHPRQGRVLFHSGGLPGFGSHVEWLPECDLAVFAFANATYAPMRAAVGEAIEALDRAGLLVPEAVEPAPELIMARDLAVRAYQQGTMAGLAEIAASNLFLDRDLESRSREVSELRGQHGRCTKVGPLSSRARLRAHFTLHCEAGDLRCELWLSPTSPARVQLMSFASVAAEPD